MTADGGANSLEGECRFVPVPHADAFVVAAGSVNGATLAWVEADQPGSSVATEATADGAEVGRITFSGVEIPAEHVLADGPAATQALDTAIDYGVLGNCAELLGLMDRALELTLEYLKTRKQFGKPIGAFQVLQHRTVDLWMLKEVSEHATTAAIRTASAPDVPAHARALAASSAKARVGEAALKIVNEAIQLHGAIGFTDEYDLALYANRALTIAPFLGNAAEHRQRYGDLKSRSTTS